MALRLRPILSLVLSLLLVCGAFAQGFWLCETGAVCHACDGCGQIDPCGDRSQDCTDCCSYAETSPTAALKKFAVVGFIVHSDAVAVLVCGLSAPAKPEEESVASIAIRPPPSSAASDPTPKLNGLRAPPAFA